MKRFLLMILGASVAFAFPPSEAYFQNLLVDNGKVIKNTLKPRPYSYQNQNEYKICFEGEMMLSGVLERSDNTDADMIYNALRFYPDKNLSLPFLYSHSDDDSLESKGAVRKNNAWDLSKVAFEGLSFGVLLNDKNVSLPKMLDSRLFGVAAVRAEIGIKNYCFYGEGDAGREAYADLVELKLLGEIKTKYFTRKDYDYYNTYVKLSYHSKDDYINIRERANGAIVGKILKEDMVNNNGLLVYANGDFYFNPEDLDSMWLEVFYLPPDALDGKDAIYGVVHGSQIKLVD
ncbi:hypothetical protein LS68_001330 [Helicobacter sp. MIT 05-5293]|uniref:hypothetical protein n=1 Tax=Helicobacter sp. MIT 05-5293 TaxID=1548149 RepID=UPI00051D7036|nr:hypothetical protein [Helicobacter sp. MIT 05-5293]TLD81699.1 hypothetical protein LS68_001330 [Helicobacter sp. MIT 05-5293]